jgi:hypothetical protein
MIQLSFEVFKIVRLNSVFHVLCFNKFHRCESSSLIFSLWEISLVCELVAFLAFLLVSHVHENATSYNSGEY